jgi:hypothetical protein
MGFDQRANDVFLLCRNAAPATPAMRQCGNVTVQAPAPLEANNGCHTNTKAKR